MDEQPNKLQQYEAEIAARLALKKAEKAEYAAMVVQAKANRAAGVQTDPKSIPSWSSVYNTAEVQAKARQMRADIPSWSWTLGQLPPNSPAELARKQALINGEPTE